MKEIKLRIEFEDSEVIVYAGKVQIDRLGIFQEWTSPNRYKVIETEIERASIEFEERNDLKANQEYQRCTYNDHMLFRGTQRQCIKFAQNYLYAKYAENNSL